MRPIDADELLKKLDPAYQDTMKLIGKGETHLDTLAEGYTECFGLISAAPTLENQVAGTCKDCRWHPYCGEEQDVFYFYYGLYTCPMWDNGGRGRDPRWNGEDNGFCHMFEQRSDE